MGCEAAVRLPWGERLRYACHGVRGCVVRTPGLIAEAGCPRHVVPVPGLHVLEFQGKINNAWTLVDPQVRTNVHTVHMCSRT
eukprot:361805-Chlamydomonas_euryale.AAC.1